MRAVEAAELGELRLEPGEWAVAQQVNQAVALPLLPQLLIQAVAAAELDTRRGIGVTAAQVVLALSLSVMRIPFQQLPQQVVQRLPSLAVIESTHSPDLGALLFDGTLRTG
jgi:hypothetical protein